MLNSAFWRIGARIASSIALGVTLLLLARVSTVAAFGEFMLTFSLTLVLGIVIGFGAPPRALRSSAEHESAHLQRSLFALHTVVNVSITAIAVVVAILARFPATVAAGIVFGASDTIQGYAQSHFAGLNQHRAASWLIATQRIVPCVAVVVVMLTNAEPVYPILGIAFALALLVGIVAPAWSLKGGSLDISAGIRGSFHWWTYSLSNVLTQLQTPVVGAVAGTYVAGLFGIASRITGPMTLLTASVATVVVPELAKRVGTPGFKQLSDKIVKLSWGYLFLTVVAAVPITLLVVAIAGRDYKAAMPLIAAMVVAAGLSGCSQAFGSGLMALDRPASATTAIAAGGVVSLAALATFGLNRDVALLALAPVLAQIVVLVLMVLAARRLTYTAAYDPSP